MLARLFHPPSFQLALALSLALLWSAAGREKKNPHVMTKRVCVRANETDEIALLGGHLGFLSCL